MMRRTTIAAVACAAALAVAGLAGCTSSAPSNSNSNASTSVGSNVANTENGNTNSDASVTSPNGSGNANATATINATTPSVSSGQSSSKAPETVDGKQAATGKLVTTTYGERAEEVSYPGSDFDGDTELLTLLMLDEPIEVTAYKGGSDYTGEVSVVKLPNDELFRRHSGNEITITVDKWGEFPADVTGMLYDIALDSDVDGVDVVEEAAE